MDEKKHEISFKIIADAGDARSDALAAIRAAQRGEIEEASSLVEDAKLKARRAHEYQTELITGEANGELVDVNIILVHAEDHLTMATIMVDVAEAFIMTAMQMSSLREELERNKC